MADPSPVLGQGPKATGHSVSRPSELRALWYNQGCMFWGTSLEQYVQLKLTMLLGLVISMYSRLLAMSLSNILNWACHNRLTDPNSVGSLTRL